MNFILTCSTRYLTREISSWTLEDKIHIHKRACNILHIPNIFRVLMFQRLYQKRGVWSAKRKFFLNIKNLEIKWNLNGNFETS